MNTLVNSHPDFGSYIMDDGNVLIEMGYVFSVGSGAGLEEDADEVPIGMAIGVREYCLKAAGKGEVIAIVEPS
jgi:hypothetical protein